MAPLEILVRAAKDLPDLDMGKKNFTDAYVQIEVAGKKAKTKTVKDSLNPRWEETLTIEAGSAHEIIFKCFDDDLLGSDFVGQCIVPMDQVPFEGWLPLTDKKNKPAGHILVNIKGAKGAGAAPVHHGPDKYDTHDKYARVVDRHDPWESREGYHGFDPYDSYDPYMEQRTGAAPVDKDRYHQDRGTKYENAYRALANYRRTRDEEAEGYGYQFVVEKPYQQTPGPRWNDSWVHDEHYEPYYDAPPRYATAGYAARPAAPVIYADAPRTGYPQYPASTGYAAGAPRYGAAPYH